MSYVNTKKVWLNAQTALQNSTQNQLGKEGANSAMQNFDEPQVLTKSERIAELQQELEELQGMGGNRGHQALMKLFQNPSAIKSSFNLSETQTQNVVSLITGVGAAGASKYLAKHLGAEIAGGIGGFLAGYIAKRIFGG